MVHNKPSRRKLALALLVTPTTLAVVSLLLFTIVNVVFNPTFWMRPDTEPVAETPAVVMVINMILVVFGALGLAAIIPGIIIGAVLLYRAKRK